MRLFWSIVAVLCSGLFPELCYAGSSAIQLFSGPAVSVWDLFPNQDNVFGLGKKGSVVQVPSPNGKQKLEFPSDGGEDDDTYTFFAVVGRHRYPIKIDGYVDPHVIWANDSSGALFTFSNGGANGGWETKLLSFYGEHVDFTDPTQQIADDFIAYRDKVGIKCEVPHEFPNLYPIGFTDRSHALIAAETVGHSICDCFGSFRAYAIELPSGKIQKSLSQARVKKIFGDKLPFDLSADPNDDWDVDPRSCALKH
jgi:hypothetical protein